MGETEEAPSQTVRFGDVLDFRPLMDCLESNKPITFFALSNLNIDRALGCYLMCSVEERYRRAAVDLGCNHQQLTSIDLSGAPRIAAYGLLDTLISMGHKSQLEYVLRAIPDLQIPAWIADMIKKEKQLTTGHQ